MKIVKDQDSAAIIYDNLKLENAEEDEEIMIISDKNSKKISGAETDVIHRNEVYLRYMRTLANKFAYFGWCKR